LKKNFAKSRWMKACHAATVIHKMQRMALNSGGASGSGRSPNVSTRSIDSSSTTVAGAAKNASFNGATTGN
jgi:hypothetical protein